MQRLDEKSMKWQPKSGNNDVLMVGLLLGFVCGAISLFIIELLIYGIWRMF